MDIGPQDLIIFAVIIGSYFMFCTTDGALLCDKSIQGVENQRKCMVAILEKKRTNVEKIKPVTYSIEL